MSIEFEKWLNDSIASIVGEINIESEKLTRDQITEVIVQALKCGDIQRHVMVPVSPVLVASQCITYVPYRRAHELEQRVKELEDEINNLHLAVQRI